MINLDILRLKVELVVGQEVLILVDSNLEHFLTSLMIFLATSWDLAEVEIDQRNQDLIEGRI